MELDVVELVFQLLDLRIEGLHPHVVASRLIHDLVDNLFRVSSDEKAPSAKLDGHSDIMEECLVLCNVVSGLKIKLKGVPYFVITGGYEEDTHTYPLEGEGAI